MSRYTPCDSGDCPYDAIGGMQCRDYCGLGVDEDSYEDTQDECDEGSEFFEEATEEEWNEANESLLDSCDNTGICNGFWCDYYLQCTSIYKD